MEEIINNTSKFKTCLDLLDKTSASATLITHNNKNMFFIFDGTLFILCEVPELKGQYNHLINIRVLKNLFKNVKDDDKVTLNIKDDIIEAKVNQKTYNKTYKFANLSEDNPEKQQTIIEKSIKLNPTNSIKTTIDWLYEQVDSLLFKEQSKGFEKVIFKLTEKLFTIVDDQKTSGESEISLFSFEEYKIEFTENSKVKINWAMIKDKIPILKRLNESILIKLKSDYPIKLISFSEGYKITVILAPMVDND